jgi:hypothetical protein
MPPEADSAAQPVYDGRIHPHRSPRRQHPLGPTLTKLAPDVQLQNDSGEEPMGLAFIDPDGEVHVYVFTEDGRQNLLGQLTGGLVLPKQLIH